MDAAGLIAQLENENAFYELINNPLAQFGTQDPIPYVGATLLPEVNQPQNEYTERDIRFRSVIANDSERYSPVQIKGTMKTASFRVSLGDSDIGNQMDAREYDEFIRLLRSAGAGVPGSPGALATLLNWADLSLVQPLLMRNEKYRWDAMVDGQVIRVGDNGYREVVDFAKPTGHRVAAGGVWSNNAYDPYPDIVAGAEFLASKGYTVNRMFAGGSVTSKLLNNTNIKQRLGRVVIAPGVITGIPGRASKEDLDGLFGEDNLPPIEQYDKQYFTQSSSGYYLKRNVLVMVASTGRSKSISLGDADPLIVPNTLGYIGIGTPQGAAAPGRVIHVRAIENSKPYRVEGESWQVSGPVVQDPEAIYVITGIS